ncbi:MAG: Xaa-Pro peptidase family protein [Oscillospiraceae bacterium]|nr:Xaa-Pro peptidase family protein [Oscillospiraceae bacterium]
MILENRLLRARQAMLRAQLDCLLLSPSSDMFYLSGVRTTPGADRTFLIITADAAHLFMPAFELGELERDTRSLLQLHGLGPSDDLIAEAARILGGCAAAGVARLVPSWITLSLMERCERCRFSDAQTLLGALRVVKTQEEYRILKDVQIRSGKAFLQLLNAGVCGRTEREVMRMFITCSAEQGIDSKGPLVASGANTALPHHTPGDRVIRAGDVVFMDFGGADTRTLFRADTTRTFAVKRAPERLSEIYGIVLEANEAAMRAAKPGVPCREVDAAARRIIARAGYAAYFTHGLGHGLGLDMHERPFLSPSADETVAAGQVFSDEPGIYLPGEFGVRTEDILYIRSMGAERLTELPHTLSVYDA